MTSSTPPKRFRSYSLIEHFHEARVSRPTRTSIATANLGDEERPVIQTEAPSRIVFENMLIPPGARLEFGVGLPQPGDVPDEADGVEFSIQVQSGDSSSTLWTTVLDPHRDSELRWKDVTLDLAELAGSNAHLVLETHPRNDASFDFGVWSSPVLRSSGSPVDLAHWPIGLRQLLDHVSPSENSLSLRVPGDATVVLAGDIAPVRDPNALRTARIVRFSCRMDGRVVLHKRLRPGSRRVSFIEEINASASADGPPRTIACRFAPKATAADPIQARWLPAAVYSTQLVGRAPSGDGQNLLFLVVDTLRADHLGTYGYQRPTSPALDRFARTSLVFDQASSQSSWTMPATASLLTGLYPHTHGVISGQALPPGSQTFPVALQQAGFTTIGISTNPIVGRQEGLSQGFEHFLHLPWANAASANQLLAQFLEEHQDLRWLAYVHYIDPHDPYDAPPPYRGLFNHEKRRPERLSPAAFVELAEAVNRGEPTLLSGEDLQWLQAAYDEEIRYWDSQFASLLSLLARLDLIDRTTIVVTSDHGEEFLEHGMLRHGQSLFEEQLHVPLIVSSPGFKPGRFAPLVETRCLFSLALSLSTGSQRSWLASLRNRPLQRITAIAQTGHAQVPGILGRHQLSTIRDSRWKYLSAIEAAAEEQLFDLAVDPAERLPVDNPDRLATYRHLLERRISHNSRPGSEEPDIIEKLRSLGYIE